MRARVYILCFALAACTDDEDDPLTEVVSLDLAASSADTLRVVGSVSTGRFGVPVASGFDCNGDGFMDYAMSAMRASPEGRPDAGQVFLVFGDGAWGRTIDTGVADTSVLAILGATATENAGIEVWIDDVTGDGLGDVIVGRSNYSPTDRTGAGAVTVVAGSAALSALAEQGRPLDLASPPDDLVVVTFVGAAPLDRLGFWNRTGDATGDGVADLLISADQADLPGADNAGAVYLVRGGEPLQTSRTIDLAEFGTTALAGHIVRFEPPPGATDYHFGATLALIDLDANGRAEVLSAAALARVGGLLVPAGAPASAGVRVGGNPGGSLFIYWDDVIPTTPAWPPGLTIAFDSTSDATTRIDGGTIAGLFASDRFGEELIGGEDYDLDGRVDLFVGDIRGDQPGQPDIGLGHVLFDAAALRGRSFDVASPPDGVRVTHLLGPQVGAISSDTSLHGDIDGDGATDLVVASPLASPEGRRNAGVVHVLWGQSGPWPAVIDFANPPDNAVFKLTNILGARGATQAEDAGDTLMYSAVGADVDGDGQADLVMNEMLGNGLRAAAFDVGTLLIVSGASVPKP